MAKMPEMTSHKTKTKPEDKLIGCPQEDPLAALLKPESNF
jgi:hypothetical protein